MAGVIGVANTAEVALAAATTKTVLQIIAAANKPIKIKEWGVYFDGISVTAEPVQIRLIRQTTAGAGSTAVTPVERTASGITMQTSATCACTAEPTSGNIMAVREVHPQSGYQEKFSFGDEIIVPAGGRIGVDCTAPATVNVRAEIVFEE